MNEEKNISYSATDIERYHKGLMTATEMNALEKAALDDPFLADAMEGYSAVPVNVQADIALLNKKLDERTSDRKVIPLPKSNFPWLRVAALFVIIIGAGLLTYRYVLHNEKSDVASMITTDSVQNKNNKADTIQLRTTTTEAKPAEPELQEKEKTVKNNSAGKKITTLVSDKESKTTLSDSIKVEPGKADDLTTTSKQFTPAPVKAEDDKSNGKGLSRELNEVELKKTFAKEKNQKSRALIKDTSILDGRLDRSYNFSQDKNASAQNNKINTFRGQVLDANNSPLPFSNVTIVPDNIGTYSDAKGYFTLISPDSTLNVKVRSVGFENNTALLQNKSTSNAIILQPDTKNIPSTVISNRKINTERTQQNSNMTLEEPEPADGWNNYDTYIANNIKIPEEIKTKAIPENEVELSFDVNKEGAPVNIKVEKSVCKECDEEAIRLLKEGPKWKKKKKNHRAQVAVPFQPANE